jgi:3-hydroxyacyl-CoA dehydrogenase
MIGRNIVCGSYESMLERACSEADWILECVTEDITVKRQMYGLVDQCRRPDSIISSITSSLPLDSLTEGLSGSFCSHFLSTHFYNPPGKLTACEISGTRRTDPTVVTSMAHFLTTRVRRTVVPVRPTAGFAGNRIAFLLLAYATQLAEERGVELVDLLIGPYTGRVMPPLATIDLVGLDVHVAIIRSLMKHTNHDVHEKLVIPPYVDEMIKMGCLGRKTPRMGGFYKVSESGKCMYIDPITCTYVSAIAPHIRFIEDAKELIHLGMYRKAFRTILDDDGEEANIVKEVLAMYIAYSYALIGEVTEAKYGIRGIDTVMSTGFNWAPPSLMVNMIGGREAAIGLIESQELPVPHQLREGEEVMDHYLNGGKYFLAK